MKHVKHIKLALLTMACLMFILLCVDVLLFKIHDIKEQNIIELAAVRSLVLIIFTFNTYI